MFEKYLKQSHFTTLRAKRADKDIRLNFRAKKAKTQNKIFEGILILAIFCEKNLNIFSICVTSRRIFFRIVKSKWNIFDNLKLCEELFQEIPLSSSVFLKMSTSAIGKC